MKYTWKYAIRDLKTGLLLSSMLVPFPFLGLFSAPWWAWAIYFGWMGFIYFANSIRPHRKARKTKVDRVFQTFQIEDEEDVA